MCREVPLILQPMIMASREVQPTSIQDVYLVGGTPNQNLGTGNYGTLSGHHTTDTLSPSSRANFEEGKGGSVID